MDRVIKRLVDMDKEARAIVAQAEEQKDQVKAQVAQKRKELYASFIDRDENWIEEKRKHAKEEARAHGVKQSERFSAEQNSLDQIFAQNKDAWVKDIVDSCISS